MGNCVVAIFRCYAYSLKTAYTIVLALSVSSTPKRIALMAEHRQLDAGVRGRENGPFKGNHYRYFGCAAASRNDVEASSCLHSIEAVDAA